MTDLSEFERAAANLIRANREATMTMMPDGSRQWLRADDPSWGASPEDVVRSSAGAAERAAEEAIRARHPLRRAWRFLRRVMRSERRAA